MAEYIESNVTLIRNLIEDKYVSEILRQDFPEVTRGFSESNVRLFCAKYGIKRTERIRSGITLGKKVIKIGQKIEWGRDRHK